MKVFISWSGERSKSIALSLRNWLPKVLQASDPWMSQEDISSGVRWSMEIFGELEKTKVGIICVTPENQHNPWIMYESGALSKSIKHTYVIPFLFDMTPGQISGPLVQFQAVQSNEEGTLKLLNTLNRALDGKGLEDSELEEVFKVWWSRLEESLRNVPEYLGEKQKNRTQSEILEEILENTREQLRKEEIRLNSIMQKEDSLIEMLDGFKSSVGQIASSTKEQKHLILDFLKESGTGDQYAKPEDLLQKLSPQINFNKTFEQLGMLISASKQDTKDLLNIRDEDDQVDDKEESNNE